MRGRVLAGALLLAMMAVGAWLLVDKAARMPGKAHLRHAPGAPHGPPRAPPTDKAGTKAVMTGLIASRSPYDGAPEQGPFIPTLTDPPREGFLERIAQWESALEANEPVDAFELFNHLNACVHNRLAIDHQMAQCAARSKGCNERQRASLQAFEAICRTISHERMERRFRYLDLAASRGDVRAQTMFGHHPPPGMHDEEWRRRHPLEVLEWDRRVMAYRHAAADRGSLYAMVFLASAYQDGFHGPADPVLAYAYMLANWKLSPIAGGEDNRTYWGRGLDDAQIREAHELRDRIVGRCCGPR